MSEKVRKINVLWIDDQPSERFCDDAFDQGFNITTCTTVKAGINELQDQSKTYEAIILDANCKIDSENEVPNVDALSEAITEISEKHIRLPWFVFTGGSYDGKESVRHIVPSKNRRWDERKYYNKPEEAQELFNAIHKAVDNSEVTKIKNKYAEAFNIYSSQDLLKILQEMDTDEFATDSKVPNTIRKIAENICIFLKDNKIYPVEFKSSNSLKECSKLFGTDRNAIYVPTYIQRMFHFLSDYANEGSHASSSGRVNKEILSGRAKHLNRTAVDALLNIFSWCSDFPISDKEKMKPIQKYFENLNIKLDSNNNSKKETICPKCGHKF